MKFGVHLGIHLTPEWRVQYIRYIELKELLYQLVSKLPALPHENDIHDHETNGELASGIEARRSRYTQRSDGWFFAECEDELSKVGLFFEQKMAETLGHYRQLIADLEGFKGSHVPSKFSGHSSNAHSVYPESIEMTGHPPLAAHGVRTRKLSTVVEMAAVTAGIAKTAETKTEDQLKLAFSEFYLSLIMLQNYQQLNATGFRKILKKHDKLFGNDSGRQWYKARVETAAFFKDDRVDKLITDTEDVFIRELQAGDRTSGMKRLRVPPLNSQLNAWTVFRLGFELGIFLVIFVYIVASFNALSDRPAEPKWAGVRLFRGFFLLFLEVWLVGANIYGWRRNGVNHVLIFEVNPRDNLSHQSLMATATALFVVWSLCVLGYLHAFEFNMSPMVFPLILLTITLVYAVVPLKAPAELMQRSSRYWLLRYIYRCFTAPFHAVTFSDFWLADQMTSLVPMFLDFEYFLCFYATHGDFSLNPHTHDGQLILNATDSCVQSEMSKFVVRPLVGTIPFVIRFLQCLRRYRDTHQAQPHLVNAGKYSTAFLTLAGSLLHARWPENPFLFGFFIFCQLFSTLYKYAWDILMDWGLFEKGAPRDRRFLRSEIIYRRKWYYYFAIVIDFVMRMTWLAKLRPLHLEGELVGCITGPIEVVRRFMWNFFRLENEHVNNCGAFRAVRDISIKPLAKEGHMQRKWSVADMSALPQALQLPQSPLDTIDEEEMASF